jgi:uncharacterized protein YjbI with pentapeptide repeats
MDWVACAEPDCFGARIEPADRCLRHLPEADRKAYVKGIAADGGRLDLRGTRFSSALLTEIRGLLPGGPERPRIPYAILDGAIFEEDANFDLAIFSERASFDGARFEGKATFNGVSFDSPLEWTSFFRVLFRGNAEFDGAVFSGVATFDRTLFQREASFRGASFGGEARFRYARFCGPVSFKRSDFRSRARFMRTGFSGRTTFDRAAFAKDAMFARTTFRGEASFRGAHFEKCVLDRASFCDQATFAYAAFGGRTECAGTVFRRDADFRGATFDQAVLLGPLLTLNRLLLDQASFSSHAKIQASAKDISCSATSFRGGTKFRARWATVSFEDADFGGPSYFAEAPKFARLDDSELENRSAAEGKMTQPKPRLVSLRWADVGNLTLAYVDLYACRFHGVSNLSGLQIGLGVEFPPTPAGWRREGTLFPTADKRAPLLDRLRWTRRRTVVEELQWMSARKKLGQPLPTPLALAPSESVPEPEDIALIYRQLSAGRAQSKDERGAADFRYGEMEMRRHGTKRSHPEHWLLAGYWLLSGYGLRASRALVALLAMFGVFLMLFSAYGFRQSTPTAQIVAYSAQTATGLLSGAPLSDLTTLGDILQLLLRALGPSLILLSALSALRRWIGR